MKVKSKLIYFDEGESLKLNLGCGQKKRVGYVNLDMDESINPDIVCDIDKGLPFNDDSVYEVYSEHFLEHVKDIHFVLKEIKRVLKKGGKFISRVPHFSGLSAHYYQHNRTFRGGDPRDFGFKVRKIELVFWFGMRLNENRLTTFYERFMILNHLIPCKEVYFELEK